MKSVNTLGIVNQLHLAVSQASHLRLIHDSVSMEKSVFMDILGSMRQNMQAQNEEVKWKGEIDKDINKDINKEGLPII